LANSIDKLTKTPKEFCKIAKEFYKTAKEFMKIALKIFKYAISAIINDFFTKKLFYNERYAILKYLKLMIIT